MGKTSQKTTASTVYGDTTTSNPYAYAKTNNSGTVSGFQDGSAFNSIYNLVNNSISPLLNEYLNPNLNSTTNQAKLNSFMNTLNQNTQTNLENNIINPLSNRNMIRSSQATDLYKNLSNQNIAAISDYANDLISNSQNNTADMIGNLMSYYMLGANYLSNLQNQSLQTSAGNATTQTSSSSDNINSILANRAVNEIILSALSAIL